MHLPLGALQDGVLAVALIISSSGSVETSSSSRGRLAVIFCSVMLVGLADILASPRGYHLYLRIVVHLGHVLGIPLLLVVEDEMETVSSSAFFSWLSSAAIR